MQLTEDDITRFQELIKKYYHEDISRQEALEQKIALVRFFQILIQVELREMVKEKQNPEEKGRGDGSKPGTER